MPVVLTGTLLMECTPTLVLIYYYTWVVFRQQIMALIYPLPSFPEMFNNKTNNNDCDDGDDDDGCIEQVYVRTVFCLQYILCDFMVVESLCQIVEAK